jgi:TolB-like protein/DNA-binding SARP family transcriptional activator
MTRDKLVAYLWPEKAADRARHSLSDSVYRINRALDVDAVVAIGDELRLDAEVLPSDVAEFEGALEDADWERAIELYVGPFLDGFHLSDAGEFERWLDGERERLARRYGEALERLAEGRATGGDFTGAVEAWRRRAAHDRYDSRVAIRLMEALEAAGNRAGALRHARVHAQLLEHEFGADPDPDVVALAERLRNAPEQEATSEGAAEARRGPKTDGPKAEDGKATATDAPARPTTTSSRRRRLSVRSVLAGLLVLLGAGAAWFAWGSAGSGSASPSAPASLAVLPFDNLTGTEENRYFTDGVTEEILTNLARVGDLRVIARASVMPYRDTDRSVPEIAEELDVDHILEGSVRRDDDRVRISARLVDVATNAQVWAETYDRRLEDVFAVQTDIATRVADALEAELSAEVAESIERPPTEDLEAYNFYLRGRYYWHRRTEDDLLESARFFERAVERDSSYARAWSGLADAYAVLAFYDYLPPLEAYPRAKEAATRALEIDETLGEAHASLGYITLYHDWDAARAETAFRRAIELNPSYSVAHQWYANLLVATGRFDEAEREMSRAREVNPLSLIANGALGWVYYYAGRHEEAVEQCDRALEMDPDWDLGHLWRGLALEEMGRTDGAIASLRRAVDLSEGSGITVAALAHALASADQTAEARDLLSDLVRAGEEGRYQPSFEIAKVHVTLGEADEALRWLERAYEERSHSMVFLEVDPQLAPLRSEPAFRRLVERVGLQG